MSTLIVPLNGFAIGSPLARAYPRGATRCDGRSRRCSPTPAHVASSLLGEARTRTAERGPEDGRAATRQPAGRTRARGCRLRARRCRFITRGSRAPSGQDDPAWAGTTPRAAEAHGQALEAGDEL